MNAERNQLVEADVLVALFFQLLHPFRSRPMNSHGDELVRVQPLEVLRLDFPGKFQADIVDGHRPLSVFIYPFETERLHLLRIFWIGYEMKQPRSLAVVQKSIAFEFAGVSRDGEMNLLPS